MISLFLSPHLSVTHSVVKQNALNVLAPMKQKKYELDETSSYLYLLRSPFSHTHSRSFPPSLWINHYMDWYVFILDLIWKGSQLLQLHATVPKTTHQNENY